MMRRTGKPSRAGERGTTVLEMAMVLPVFLLLVFGALDLGRAVYVRNVLANAARDGARFATVDPTNVSCARTVAANLGSIANLTAADVTVQLPATIAIDQPVTVTVRSSYQPLSSLVAGAIGVNTIAMSGTATMRIRNVPTAPLTC